MQGLGFRVQGSGFRVQGSGLAAWSFGVRVSLLQGLELPDRADWFGFEGRICGCAAGTFRVQGVGEK